MIALRIEAPWPVFLALFLAVSLSDPAAAQSANRPLADLDRYVQIGDAGARTEAAVARV